MMIRRSCRILIAALAVFTLAGPALAGFHVRYDGETTLRFETSTGQTEPGAMNGTFDFSAIFYYDDFGEQQAASLIVADVLRSHYVFCPWWPGPNCPALVATPTSIASQTGTTPEDFINVGVVSPSQFGGVPLFGVGRRRYLLVPGDDGSGYLSWALFDNASGFAWNSGSAAVEQVTVGVPEPASWAMLITGFGLTGAMLRRRQRAYAA